MTKYRLPSDHAELGAQAAPKVVHGVTWQINWRLLIVTLLGVVILAPVAHYWHSYQLKRNGAIFLARADVLQRELRWPEAVPFIERYLSLYPADIEARVRLAQVFDHVAEASPGRIPASLRLYSIAVGLAPDRPELRRRYAHRLIDMGRFSDALDESREALRLRDGDARALQLRAVAAYGHARSRGDFSAAPELIGNFTTAIAASRGTPEHVDLAVQLAELYRRDLKEPSTAERNRLADRVVDEMVAANDRRAGAWIARYLYHERHDGAGSDQDLNRALELEAEEGGSDAGSLAATGTEPGSDVMETLRFAYASANSGQANANLKGLMARLLIARGYAGDRERGRQILENLLERGRCSDDDRVALIGFYRSQGDHVRAREHAFALVDRTNPQPLHLARYIELLIKSDSAADAGPWLTKLLEIDPNSLATLSLQARLLAREGQHEQVESLIEGYRERRLSVAGTEPATSQVLLAVGRLYAQLDMAAQAEQTFRDLQMQKAGGYQPLALWLASHGRAAEAVDICLEAAAEDNTAQAATTLVRSLLVGGANEDLASRAEPLLAVASEKHGKNPDYLLMLATWRLFQQRSDESIRLLRRVLSMQPRNTLAMNNLADALSERPETRPEALALIDRAIAQAGPLAELLDTKGTLLLLEGDVAGAIKEFQKATSSPGADPRHLFHLALALRRAGQTSESREAFQRANKQSLGSAVLSPTQKRLRDELERDSKG